jgi:hypothetical protein
MSRLSRHRRVSFTPGLRVFLTKVMTPSVLVLGILLLVFFNFNAILKAEIIKDDHFNGDIAFSRGGFAYRFQKDAGLDRPALSYNRQDLVSYSEWGSTISIDGQVQELWNNYHGYDYDEAKQQTFSTTTSTTSNATGGNGWQLIETVTLVNDHTVTVTYNFDASPYALPGPELYVIDIAHVTSTAYQWYNCQVNNNTFTGQVMSGNGTQAFLNKPKFFGLLSLSMTGSHAAGIRLQNTTTVTNGKGNITIGQEFLTEYRISNPTPSRLITLGAETLTFQPNVTSPDAPLPLPAQGTTSFDASLLLHSRG